METLSTPLVWRTIKVRRPSGNRESLASMGSENVILCNLVGGPTSFKLDIDSTNRIDYIGLVYPLFLLYYLQTITWPGIAAGLEGATVTNRHCASLQTQSKATICKVTIVFQGWNQPLVTLKFQTVMWPYPRCATLAMVSRGNPVL